MIIALVAYDHMNDATRAKAVDLLRKAQRDFDKQFRIVANLGTAWQLAGDYDQAMAALEEAVTLSPGKYQKPCSMRLCTTGRV